MFWEKFVFLCNKHNTNPNAVCAELKLSNATATHWKNGSIPRDTTLKKIADYFDVTPDYLLGRTDVRSKPKPSIADLIKSAASSDNNNMTLQSDFVVPPAYRNLDGKKENPSAGTDEGEKLKNLTPEEREILKLFDSAPPQLRQAALAVLRSAEHPGATPDADGTKK